VADMNPLKEILITGDAQFRRWHSGPGQGDSGTPTYGI